jgi:hypothetical protein
MVMEETFKTKEGIRVWTFEMSLKKGAMDFGLFLYRNQTNTEYYFDGDTAIVNLKIDNGYEK